MELGIGMGGSQSGNQADIDGEILLRPAESRGFAHGPLLKWIPYNAPMSTAHERLVQFLDKKMQMSHIYQPVMLEVLLTCGRRAPIRTIATASSRTMGARSTTTRRS
jgi:hypothetical protein